MFELLLGNGDIPVLGKWRQISAPFTTPGISVGMMVADGNYIYIFGGRTSTSIYITNMWRYDTIDGTWLQLKNMPAGRYEASAAVFNGVIYVTPGRASTGLVQTILAYSIADDEWTTVGATIPITGLRLQRCFTQPTGVQMVGGRNGGGPIGNNYLYNPVNDTLTTLASVQNNGYSDAGYMTNDGKAILIGGTDATGTLSNINQSYDIIENKWTILAPCPNKRGNSAAAELDGLGYVYGGVGTPTGFQVYDIENNTWSVLNEIQQEPPSRIGHTMVSCNGKLYISQGNTGSIYHNDFWEYTPQL